jgi:hypothetical protein
MKNFSKFSLATTAILSILLFSSQKGVTKSTDARFYVVCYSGNHQWGGGYCGGGVDDIDTADRMVADHNRQYEGHSAGRCAGKCPPCN